MKVIVTGIRKGVKAEFEAVSDRAEQAKAAAIKQASRHGYRIANIRIEMDTPKIESMEQLEAMTSAS